jgi:hypothetical protein
VRDRRPLRPEDDLRRAGDEPIRRAGRALGAYGSLWACGASRSGGSCRALRAGSAIRSIGAGSALRARGALWPGRPVSSVCARRAWRPLWPLGALWPFRAGLADRAGRTALEPRELLLARAAFGRVVHDPDATIRRVVTGVDDPVRVRDLRKRSRSQAAEDDHGRK